MEGMSAVADAHTARPPGAGAETRSKPEVAPLTFSELNRRLSAMPYYDEPSPRSRRRTRIGFLTTLTSFAAAIIIQHLPLSGTFELKLLIAVLIIEVGGLLATIWYSRREYVNVLKPFEDLARQLDHDFPHHFDVCDWLVSQPADLLEKYGAMAAFRRERYAQKMPLLAGNVATLGVIPVLAAVYYQGRQILEGQHLTWIDWAFGFFLLLFYFLTWTMSLTKSRLEAMDMHLQAALAESSKRAENSPAP